MIDKNFIDRVDRLAHQRGRKRGSYRPALGRFLPYALYRHGHVPILIVALVLLAGGVMAVRQLEQRTVRPPPCDGEVPRRFVGVVRRNLVLNKGRNGHFEVEARVDGRRLEFLVDTGASISRCAKARPHVRDLSPRGRLHRQVSTANGMTKAALGGIAHG